MILLINETKTIDATPELLAQMFWEMDNDQQAEFFDALAKVSNGLLSDQMTNVASFTDGLTQRALDAMVIIGNCAKDRDIDET